MTITDSCATTVSVPLETPLRHASGMHPGRFVRTRVDVESAFQWLKGYMVGHDVFEAEALRCQIAHPAAATGSFRLAVA